MIPDFSSRFHFFLLDFMCKSASDESPADVDKRAENLKYENRRKKNKFMILPDFFYKDRLMPSIQARELLINMHELKCFKHFIILRLYSTRRHIFKILEYFTNCINNNYPN